MNDTFDLCGGHLALDFANTLGGRHTGVPVEYLKGYADLLSFARQTGIITVQEATALAAQAGSGEAAAAAVVTEAQILREGLYSLFAAVASGNGSPPEGIAALNRAFDRLSIGTDLALTWQDLPGMLDGFMGAVACAAVSLAIDSQERSRVRLCEAPDCLWLFYDGSRNRSRRWCDMRQCGNRMKARRHYQRSRSDGAQNR